MNLPDIAIINFSTISDPVVQRAIRAVNRQVMEDFLPIWGSGYLCQLHDSAWGMSDEETLAADPVQAAGVIYLVDESHLAQALGYHSLNAAEVPYGFVFTSLGDWTITLSHEVLEMIADPTVNIFVPGPHPFEDRWVFHAYEVCDAVERTSYSIDGVEVSNFVTPQYFSEGNAPGTRNDFLGVDVDSFGVTDGSHLGVVDPTDFDFEVIYGRKESTSRRALQRFERSISASRRSRVCEDDASVPAMKIFAEFVSGRKKGVKGPEMKGLSRGQRYQAAAGDLKYRATKR